MGELALRLRRFRATQARLTRLHVPLGVSNRLAPLFMGRDVHIHGDIATFPAGPFMLSAPRRFLTNYLAAPYEPQLTRWVEEHLPTGGTAIDVGAHIGYLAMVMANGVGPTGQVFAIEPALETVQYLARNIAQNDIRNINILPVAIADVPGLAAFNINESSDSFGFFEHPNTATVTTSAVPVMSLDLLFSESTLPRLDLIKIDVEGAEPQALVGMEGTLHRFPDAALLVEWFPEIYLSRGIDPMNVPRWLKSFGYHLAVVDAPDGGPTTIESVEDALGRGELSKSWYCNLVGQRTSEAEREAIVKPESTA